MRRLIPPLHEGMKDLLPMIDRDTRAFDAYLAAVGMPKDTAEEKAARHAAMQDGLKAAVQVPLEVMRTADRCWEAMAEMAAHGNPASRSDLEVGARALETGIWGALPQRRHQPARHRGRAVPQGHRRGGGRARRPRGPDAGHGPEGGRRPYRLTLLDVRRGRSRSRNRNVSLGMTGRQADSAVATIARASSWMRLRWSRPLKLSA